MGMSTQLHSLYRNSPRGQTTLSDPHEYAVRRTTVHRLVVRPPSDSTLSEQIICPICRSWREPKYALCAACAEGELAFGDLAPVVPISMYKKPSALRELLTFYKPSRAP